MSEIKELANQISADAAEFQDEDPEFAKELLEIANMARQYELRDNRHQEIIAQAKVQKANGVDLDQVYREASAKLLETWPDAEAYGNALVALKAALLEDQ